MSRAHTVASLLTVVSLMLASVTPAAQAATIEVYYGPEDGPGDKVMVLYDQVRRYIYVAMYGLTYPAAVHALLMGKRCGVDIRVIADREKLRDLKQRAALHTLRLGDILIRVNIHDGPMHLKQVIVDDRVNTSGSMNLTTSGHAWNDERLDIIRDPVITARARDKFLAMWRDPARYERWVE